MSLVVQALVRARRVSQQRQQRADAVARASLAPRASRLRAHARESRAESQQARAVHARRVALERAPALEGEGSREAHDRDARLARAKRVGVVAHRKGARRRE
jgi:hypothetical protein